MCISGRFVGNGLDRSVLPYQKYDISGNHAPFGAILCAARGQMCGWVETHPYKSSGNRPFLQAGGRHGSRAYGVPVVLLQP